MEQFEKTSRQLGQRLLQQQKAAARTNGLKHYTMIPRSKSQPSITLTRGRGSLSNMRTAPLGFGSSQPRFPGSSSSSVTSSSVQKNHCQYHRHLNTSIHKSTSDFHTSTTSLLNHQPSKSRSPSNSSSLSRYLTGGDTFSEPQQRKP